MTDYKTTNLRPETFERLVEYEDQIGAGSHDEAVRWLLNEADADTDDDPDFVRLEADAVERIADSVEERMRGSVGP